MTFFLFLDPENIGCLTLSVRIDYVFHELYSSNTFCIMTELIRSINILTDSQVNLMFLHVQLFFVNFKRFLEVASSACKHSPIPETGFIATYDICYAAYVHAKLLGSENKIASFDW